MPAATPCAGIPAISDLRRSTAPGRSSTTNATAADRAAAAIAGSGGCHACHSHQILPGALPADAQPDGLDRRTEAARVKPPISTAKSSHELSSLHLAAGDRGADGAAGLGPHRGDLLRDPPGHDRRGYPGADPRQRGLGGVLWSVRHGGVDSRLDRAAQCVQRMVPVSERRAGWPRS